MLQIDGFALAAHRARGGLDELDDTQSELAVRFGDLTVFEAVDEVLRLDAQRLGQVELRRPHVARPVADTHLLDLLWVVRETDPFVVHLDLLARFEVIVDDHLLAAADEDLADLDRRKPAYVGMRDWTRGIEKRDVG